MLQMPNVCSGFVQIFDVGDHFFIAFEGFAQICRVNNPIEGIESFSDISDKVGEDNCKMNKEKKEENLLSLAQKILIGRNLKKRKRALFGADAPSTLLKIRKIDHLKALDEGNSENDKINNNKEDENEELQLIINELRLRNVEKMSSKRILNAYGFYLLNGAKFGCDYLAYEKPPGEKHSLFMVICSDVNKSLNIYNLIATSRVSTQVKKKILLAVVNPGTLLPYYLEMNWWKGDGNR
uniref:tRNA-intron lyase n=1 Tax=Meloidogyne hapla TaxID=6305 RepID=A0A1I8C0S8_MELHA